MPDNTWVVVADSAHARVLQRVSVKELREVDDLVHPESRLHEGDLRTGGQGAVTDRAGYGEHQSDPSVSTGEMHTGAFAGEIAGYLSKARHGGDFERLVLVAEPALLGALRKHLDRPTARTVERAIDKNWVSKSPDELLELLADDRGDGR